MSPEQNHLVEPDETLAALVQRTPEGLDNYDATVWLVDQLRAIPDGLSVAFPTLHAYVVQNGRNEVRILEHAIVRQFTPGDGTKPARNYVGELSLLQLREYKDAKVKIPGRQEKVRAGEVTRREWDLRDAYLAKKESGLARSRSFIRAVVRTHKVHGCDCIDDALTKEGN